MTIAVIESPGMPKTSAGIHAPASALLFAAYHWWTGLGNVTLAFLFGIVAMIAYRRCRTLWPVVVGHYLADLVSFA